MGSARIERSYTISELHAMTGIPKSTIYKSMRKGKLDAFTPGGCPRGKRPPASCGRSAEAPDSPRPRVVVCVARDSKK